jgi:hypothetical protein
MSSNIQHNSIKILLFYEAIFLKPLELFMKSSNNTFTALFFILFSIMIFFSSIYKPDYSWDMIGYIGAAKSFENQDIAATHTFTYDQIEKRVPGNIFWDMTHGDNMYREAVYSDPTAFSEQLPYYKIRVIYTELLYLLHKSGIDMITASHLISGLSVSVAMMILYFLAISYIKKPMIYLIPPLAIVLGIIDLARLSTPDSLIFLVIILSAYFYLKNKNIALFILQVIMIGIRTDLILFSIPLLITIYIILLPKIRTPN